MSISFLLWWNKLCFGMDVSIVFFGKRKSCIRIIKRVQDPVFNGTLWIEPQLRKMRTFEKSRPPSELPDEFNA